MQNGQPGQTVGWPGGGNALFSGGLGAAGGRGGLVCGTVRSAGAGWGFVRRRSGLDGWAWGSVGGSGAGGGKGGSGCPKLGLGKDIVAIRQLRALRDIKNGMLL